MPESLVWYAIAREFKTRYVNEQLRVYCHDEPVRLTLISQTMRSTGRLLLSESVLNHDIGWIRYAPKEFFVEAIQYSRCSFHVRRDIRQQMRGLENRLAQILWAAALPFGLAAYLKDSGGPARYLGWRRG